MKNLSKKILALVACAALCLGAISGNFVNAHNQKVRAASQTTQLFAPKQISAGQDFSLAISGDGSLWSWGYNNNGELGDGTTTDRNIPVRIGTDNNWSSISAGDSHSLAIKTDGSLWAWGYNYDSELGDGTTINRNAPVRIGTENNWSSISAGSYHSLAIKEDGSLWAWGYNSCGQLGDGTETDSLVPIKIGSSCDWKSISAGSYHSLAIKIDGSLWAWGSYCFGQLGDGCDNEGDKHPSVNNYVQNSPEQIGVDTDWLSISAGESHTLALKVDGSLWAWGYNSDWQLGNGSSGIQNQPDQVFTDDSSSDHWLSISAGANTSFAINRNGTLWWCGRSNYSTKFGERSNTFIQINDDNDWLSVSSSGRNTLAIKINGTIWAWGDDEYGQLGNGKSGEQHFPIQCEIGTNWSQISAGSDFSLGIKTDGTLWAWGRNNHGQLGIGSYDEYESLPMQIGGDKDWAIVSAGGYHSLALKNDGSLWAWGDNYYGQLGDGTNDDSVIPIKVGNKNWSSISAGYEFSLAITEGSLWAWGDNSCGQLGNGTTDGQNTPTQVEHDIDWLSISAGYYHSLAIKADGNLWAWGDNEYGQLGDDSVWEGHYDLPERELLGCKSISAGEYHSLAIRNDDSLWVCGLDDSGQLGIGDGHIWSYYDNFMQVGNEINWSLISAGDGHSLALKTYGSLWSWGDNSYGQLGDGNGGYDIHSDSLIQVGNDTNWSSISAGGSHTLAIKSDGSLWAWGDNEYGQLGTGYINHIDTPQIILAFYNNYLDNLQSQLNESNNYIKDFIAYVNGLDSGNEFDNYVDAMIYLQNTYIKGLNNIISKLQGAISKFVGNVNDLFDLTGVDAFDQNDENVLDDIYTKLENLKAQYDDAQGFLNNINGQLHTSYGWEDWDEIADIFVALQQDSDDLISYIGDPSVTKLSDVIGYIYELKNQPENTEQLDALVKYIKDNKYNNYTEQQITNVATAEAYIFWVKGNLNTQADFIDQLGQTSGTTINDIKNDLTKLGEYKIAETELLSAVNNSSDYPPVSPCADIGGVQTYVSDLQQLLSTAKSYLNDANAKISDLNDQLDALGTGKPDPSLTTVEWSLIGIGALSLAVIVWYSTYMVMKRK